MKYDEAVAVFRKVGQGSYTDRTLGLYCDHLKRFGDYLKGKGHSLELGEVRVTDDILGYRQHLAERGAADNTLNLSMIALRQMWKLLCGLEGELGIELPFLWSAIPIKRGIIFRPHRPIGPDEFSKLLDAVNGRSGFLVSRDTAILLTLFHGGMRVSELTSLDVKDVDVKDQSLLLQTRKHRRFSQRRIFMPREAFKALAAYLDIRGYLTSEPALFVCLRTGKRLSTRAIERMVKLYAKRSGQDPDSFNPHIMRVGWATRAAQNLMYPSHIQTQLGHTSITGTERYIRVTNAAQKADVLRKMTQPLSPLGYLKSLTKLGKLFGNGRIQNRTAARLRIR